MKWIELKNGDLINLDAVVAIVAGENLNKVFYLSEIETIATETFATHEQVELRMKQLKDLLLEK